MKITVMPGEASIKPIRMVINGRILSGNASLFARLGAGEILQVLAGVPEIDPVLVVPEGATIPRDVDLPLRQLPRPIGELGEVAFDHWHFPREARRQRADLVLCLHPSAPLASPAPVITLYGDGDSLPASGRGGGRLARSLALGGLRGASAVLRWQDVPLDEYRFPWVEVPPIVPAVFSPTPRVEDRRIAGQLGLPESYVFVAGESQATLPLLLAGWTWVEGTLGDSYSLVIATTEDATARCAVEVADRLGIGNSLRSVRLRDEAWPTVFRGASALLHGGGRRNAAALRWALASGLPVAALATPVSDSVLGPAGFLVPDGDSRGLGAACLTILVEDEVAGSLRERALERAAAYRSESARKAWLEALTSFPRA